MYATVSSMTYEHATILLMKYLNLCEIVIVCFLCYCVEIVIVCVIVSFLLLCEIVIVLLW